jgi:xylose dehydrogenase (NAD/NADP)
MNKKLVSWGVIGCGRIAREVFNNAVCNSKTGKLHAVASRNMEKAQEIRRQFGFQKAYEGYSALLNDKEVDAVYIALPNKYHAEWAIAAANAGKHILCEKPATMNSAECEKVVAAAEEAGVFFIENFAFLFHPQSFKLRHLLDKEVIGEVISVDVSLRFKVRNLLRISKDNIRLQPNMGGGAAMDLACYMIAFSRFVFNREPISVLAYGDLNSQLKIDMTSNGILDFGNGRTATFSTSFETPGGQRGHIFGTNGEIFITSPIHPRKSEDTIVVKRVVPGAKGIRDDYEEEVIHTQVVEPFISIIDYLGDSILNGNTHLLSSKDAICNMKVLDACIKSAREGSRIWL